MTKKFYGGGEFTNKEGKIVEVSPYIEIVDQDTVRVKTSDWQGSKVTTVKRNTKVAHEKGSGYMKVGNIGGDWRQIASLSEELSYIFAELKGSDIPKVNSKIVKPSKARNKKKMKDVS